MFNSRHQASRKSKEQAAGSSEKTQILMRRSRILQSNFRLLQQNTVLQRNSEKRYYYVMFKNNCNRQTKLVYVYSHKHIR